MPRLTVVISQGQSANPKKRALEEEIVTALLFEKGIEVTVIPNLYDLTADGTGMLCLKGISGNMVLASWLFPRAAHWVLDRNGIKGHEGKTLLESEEDDEELGSEAASQNGSAEEIADATDDEKPDAIGARELPNRTIYCLDLRAYESAMPYVEEIKRISQESSVQTVDLMGFLGGNQASPEQTQRFLNPSSGNVDAGGNQTSNGAGASQLPIIQTPAASNGDAAAQNGAAPPNGGSHEPIRIEEQAGRRWYPVIDFSRCTNCMECLDFCLFGVYGVDRFETILVEQPDNCRKGCPACSRVCPANAIIFPQHKTPAIAGAPEEAGAAAFKIDLSRLFGAPDAVSTAVDERDVELMAAGRDAVGMSVGIPKRQEGKASEPKDELDSLMDELDDLEL